MTKSPDPQTTTSDERIVKLVRLYFSPWGAAKAAEWEDLTNDAPFTFLNLHDQLQKLCEIP
jgi:hypothetical protein